MHVFTYGTLMFPPVWLAVTGKRFEATRAVLPGFERFRVRGEAYPGILPARGARTGGILYYGVDDKTLRRLDRFEGELYRRIRVEVIPAGEAKGTAAETYVVAPVHRHRLSGEAWDPDAFARREMEGFLRLYPGFENT